MIRSPHIALLAGEASGDTLGSGLISELKKRVSNIRFTGIGGKKMQSQGMHSLEPMNTLSVMGFTDVIRRYRKLKKLQNSIIEYYIENKPDVFIGIDAPDFNLPIEKALKEVGIKTIHYVSPKVWAWRKERVELIRQAVDKLLCVFPFELDFFKPYDIDARYIGHPLADSIPMVPKTNEARQLLGIPENATVLTMLPGSRLNEITRMGAIFLKAADKLSRKIDSLVVVIPVVSAAAKEKIKQLVNKGILNCEVIMTEDSHAALVSASLVLSKLGTSTLEAMLFKKPMVTAYKTSWLNYYLFKSLVSIQYGALPNIIANMPVVPELIQQDVTPSCLSLALQKVLIEEECSRLRVFANIHQQLRKGANKLAANEVLSILD